MGVHSIQFIAIDSEKGLSSQTEYLVLSIVDSCKPNEIFIKPLPGETLLYNVRALETYTYDIQVE